MKAGHACLGLAWLFFAAAASLALTGSGSLEGIGEFLFMKKKERLYNEVCTDFTKRSAMRKSMFHTQKSFFLTKISSGLTSILHSMKIKNPSLSSSHSVTTGLYPYVGQAENP